MHKKAQGLEAARLASERDKGIKQAFLVMLRYKALTGALNRFYCLAKEVAHTTKFHSVKDLVIRLGCDYLHELNLRRNAHYSSE